MVWSFRLRRPERNFERASLRSSERSENLFEVLIYDRG
jgi:hypothetical protein